MCLYLLNIILEKSTLPCRCSLLSRVGRFTAATKCKRACAPECPSSVISRRRDNRCLLRDVGLWQHAHITHPLPHVLPAQDPNLRCCQEKLRDASIHCVEPEVAKHKQQRMQRTARSLGITRAAIDMILQKDQSSAQVGGEAISSTKRFAQCMVNTQLDVLENEWANYRFCVRYPRAAFRNEVAS